MAGDSSYASVVLLLHGDGANGSTTITDSSATPKTVTAYGSAQISTEQSKFGGASIKLTSAGSGYAKIAHASDFNFGNGAFTIEFFYYPVSVGAYSAIFGGDEPDYPLCIYHGSSVNSGNPIAALGPNSSSWFAAASGLSFGAVSNNTWYHIALVRQGDTFRVYKDGVQQATGATDSSGQSVGNIAELFIGKNLTNYMAAYIDEVRVTKGVCRYPDGTTFTPPAAAFLDYAGQVSGTVRDDAGAVCARTVRIVNRSTGALIASTTSDSGTGAYTLAAPSLDEVQRIVLDDSGGTLYNDLIDRVIPA